MAERWRVVAICSVKPLADALVGNLRDLGHEPVALSHRAAPATRRDRPIWS